MLSVEIRNKMEKQKIVGHSESIVTHEMMESWIKKAQKMEWMIYKGLGWEDMENDNKPPQEIR